MITRNHFLLLLDEESTDRAFPFFDTNGDGTVTRDEWVSAFDKFFDEFRSVKSSLGGHQNASRAIQVFAESIFFIMSLVVVLAFFEVPLATLFVPIGSVLLSLSFAFGGTISNVVTCFIFVVFLQPFDVGDQVACSGVNNSELMVVESIDVLTSTFRNFINRRIQVPNWMLAGMVIENHKRSPNAVFTFVFQIGVDTTMEQLTTLRARVLEYIKTLPREWKPDFSMNANEAQHGPQGFLKLTFWMTHHLSWQDGKIWRSRSNFVIQVTNIIREVGISYQMPPQPVTLSVDPVLLERMPFSPFVPPDAYLPTTDASLSNGDTPLPGLYVDGTPRPPTDPAQGSTMPTAGVGGGVGTLGVGMMGAGMWGGNPGMMSAGVMSGANLGGVGGGLPAGNPGMGSMPVWSPGVPMPGGVGGGWTAGRVTFPAGTMNPGTVPSLASLDPFRFSSATTK